MGIKLLRVFTLAGVLTIFNYSSCKKGGIGCRQENYSFNIYARLVPDLDSILINDTIWINLDEPVILQNQNSGQNINYADAVNLGSAIAFGELLGNSQSRDAVNSFNYIIVDGIEVSSVDPLRFKEFLFKEENGRYKFNLGIVPKQAGVFRLGFSDAANVYRGNGCEKAYFKILINDTDQHLYFNQWNFGVTPSLPNATYCFKVK